MCIKFRGREMSNPPLASVFKELDHPITFDSFSVFNQQHSFHVTFFNRDDRQTVSEEIFWDPGHHQFSAPLAVVVDNKNRAFTFKKLQYNIVENGAWTVSCGELGVYGQPQASNLSALQQHVGFEIDSTSLKYILKECRSVLCPFVAVSVTCSNYLFRFEKSNSIVQLTADGKAIGSAPTVILSRTSLCKIIFASLNTLKNSLAHRYTLAIHQRGEHAFFVVQYLRKCTHHSVRTTLQLQSLK